MIKAFSWGKFAIWNGHLIDPKWPTKFQPILHPRIDFWDVFTLLYRNVYPIFTNIRINLPFVIQQVKYLLIRFDKSEGTLLHAPRFNPPTRLRRFIAQQTKMPVSFFNLDI